MGFIWHQILLYHLLQGLLFFSKKEYSSSGCSYLLKSVLHSVLSPKSLVGICFSKGVCLQYSRLTCGIREGHLYEKEGEKKRKKYIQNNQGSSEVHEIVYDQLLTNAFVFLYIAQRFPLQSRNLSLFYLFTFYQRRADRQADEQQTNYMRSLKHFGCYFSAF